MNALKEKERYPSNLLYLGYISNRVQTFLKPYLNGVKFNLYEDDKDVIEEGKNFLESIIIGFESINSIDNFFSGMSRLGFGPGTSLSIALKVLMETITDYPENMNGLMNIFKEYQTVLSYLQEGSPLPKSLEQKALNTFAFFDKLEQMMSADLGDSMFSHQF